MLLSPSNLPNYQTKSEQKFVPEDIFNTPFIFQAYGSSAPGFVRPVSERSKIIEVAGKNPENSGTEELSSFNKHFQEIQSAVNKLDDDSLLSKDELIALQVNPQKMHLHFHNVSNSLTCIINFLLNDFSV